MEDGGGREVDGGEREEGEREGEGEGRGGGEEDARCPSV